jgi:hypothetical protein
MQISVHYSVSRSIPAHVCASVRIRALPPRPVPTRQTSSSGRPKSPRIQVVLPEDLCARLAGLAETESRTVSNMAKVLIQQGIERLESQRLEGRRRAPAPELGAGPVSRTDRFRAALELQEQAAPRRLRGAPRRLRLRRPAG